MANLTKRNLITRISNETGLAQNEVQAVIQSTLDIIVESLAKNDDVELRNFGVFEVKLTKPRIGRNPMQPGSQMTIPPRAIVRFKPGKAMKQSVEHLRAMLQEAENAQ